MTLARGTIEIMALADSSPKCFADFTQIKINGRKLSSATVSKRLNELVAVEILEEVAGRSKSGRRAVAYRTTNRGKQVLELALELKKTLEKKPVQRVSKPSSQI